LGGRGRRISEFEASLVYRVSSRRTTQKNSVSKKKKKKKKEIRNEEAAQSVDCLPCKYKHLSLAPKPTFKKLAVVEQVWNPSIEDVKQIPGVC
jgi:hypothetical protein